MKKNIARIYKLIYPATCPVNANVPTAPSAINANVLVIIRQVTNPNASVRAQSAIVKNVIADRTASVVPIANASAATKTPLSSVAPHPFFFY